jgi:hypothetical protein
MAAFELDYPVPLSLRTNAGDLIKGRLLASSITNYNDPLASGNLGLLSSLHFVWSFQVTLVGSLVGFLQVHIPLWGDP